MWQKCEAAVAEDLCGEFDDSNADVQAAIGACCGDADELMNDGKDGIGKACYDACVTLAVHSLSLCLSPSLSKDTVSPRACGRCFPSLRTDSERLRGPSIDACLSPHCPSHRRQHVSCGQSNLLLLLYTTVGSSIVCAS